MAGLAYYNLGLVALRRGEPRAAGRWFERVPQATQDERLLALASQQLADLPAEPPRNWAGYAIAGAGYDDNVALVANSEVLGVSGIDDAFVAADLAMSAPLGQPFRFDGGLGVIDYQDLDSFDQLDTYGGARYRIASGDWTNDASLQLGYSTLDNEGFETRGAIALQATKQPRPDWLFRVRYRYTYIDGLDEFDGVGGRQHDIRARMEWDRSSWTFDAEYRFEMSDYVDESLSATRHQLGFGGERTLGGNWLLSLHALLRHSRYDLDANGSEDRTDFDLSLARPFTERWRLVFRYLYSNNAADRAEFDYDRNRMSVAFEATL